MIRLLQFRYSPYNEKVRWALDCKRVPHERESLLPGPHMARLKKLTGRTLTPTLLTDDAQAIDGSTAIVSWLDERWPAPRLLPEDARQREAVLGIVRRFDEDIAPRARRAILATLLRTPGYFARVFGDGRGAWAQRLYAAAVPLAAPLIRQGNGIAGEASVRDGLLAIEEGLDFVARESAATGYLVGGQFSLADLTAASVLSLAVNPPDCPMSRPQPVAAPTAELIARFAAHPGAAWVRAIYARHRAATRDFDGRADYRQ